jgi:hypothetical protein
MLVGFVMTERRRVGASKGCIETTALLTERNHAMRTLKTLGLAMILLLGSVALASADTSDFALFDGSNPANQPAAGAICGANAAFTWHLTVANFGPAGEVRITYHDGDIVRFPIASGASFSMSQAGGKGASGAIRVSNGGSAAQLAGSLSAIGAGNPRCVSCDAVAEGGMGDAGCDGIIPN